MEKKLEITIEKILEYIEHIDQYCKNINSIDLFEQNTMLIEAVCFDIIQIGELAKYGLDSEARQELSNIPWNEINGLRNRVVHGYGEINHSIIWDVVKEDLSSLREELEDAQNSLKRTTSKNSCQNKEKTLK